MKRILLAALVAIAVAPNGGTPAQAQISAAIGKPLPSPDMPAGQVSVRVVAGTPSSPVSGTEVTLLVNGTPQIARTDSAGRAFFKDLPGGAKLQAKVFDEDKKEITSEEFNLGETGVRLMLSTKPWNPGGGAGMMGGGAGGAMPNPRDMSGEPRPEDKDPPGSMTVRLTYDDFGDKEPPAGVPVALVGYSADDSVKFAKVESDKEGRATFTGLDRSGGTSYFAMTLLPRGTGVDRLISTPAVLDPRVGVRLILSAEKKTSTDPNVDDLTKLEKQDGSPPAGKVRIQLVGGVEDQEVRLVDAETKAVLGRVHPQQGKPDPQDIQGQAQFVPKADLEAGTLDVLVHGGGANEDRPLSDVSIKVVPADADGVPVAGAMPLAELQTTDNGQARAKIAKLDTPLVAQILINGKPMTSKPLDLVKAGGQLVVEAHWDSEGKPEAMFDLVPRPGQVVYAETMMQRNLYRSLPFQPVTDRGSSATLFIFPRLLFTFSITSRIDDEYFAVNGRFELSNNSWVPYSGGPDGLMIPLPKGFTGGLVAESDQADVAIEPKEGFRIIRPIPPGTKQFHGAFSLPVDKGTVSWAMDLPWGAFNSGMEILQVPGMSVDTPKGADGQVMNVPQGSFFVMPRIQILPKQSMVLTIRGLPEPAAWRVWVPRVIGVAVVLLVLGGVVFALVRTRSNTAGRDARRQQLLDALVTMDKAGGKNQARRDELVAELETLWDEGPGPG
ncbi:MAG TPA: hypothetical protein VL326_35305 [Kofleriaceae bacterium]|nr:hypothetical protein [Kofleriaceae bacterium]